MEGTYFEPLYNKTSRAQDVYESIKKGILSGYWKPGHRINDLELSKDLGVSRVSVREALSKLVENQIVERVQWKGYFVKDLTVEECNSALDIRFVLEMLAIEKVIEKFDDEIGNRLQESIDIAEKDLVEERREEFMYTDFLFHEVLYEASGNTHIKHLIHNTMFLIDILRHMDKGGEFDRIGRLSIEQHRQMLNSMREDDHALTLELMRTHIEEHRKRVHRALQTSNPDKVTKQTGV